jgi:2-succinyl-5-enolpyruvyl-6-hydroxy-3-cyclohexene-1-carboxylate synthase
LVDDHAEVHDFTDTASQVVRFPPAVAVPMLPKPGTTEPDWAALWVRASAASEEIQVAVGTEPAIVADLLHRLPAGSSLHLANSMPIRHADGFGGVLANDVRVHVSRGTNGIDGTIATALGEAMAGQPAVAVVGDIAFLHDIGGLMAAGRSEENLTVVVIDNGGGSIFSFLPIAQDLEPSEFDRLFNTPHDTRVRQVTEAAGGRVVEQLDEAITRAGLDVIVIETDSEASVTAFRSARTAMTEAMRNG